jgi:uncharacterized protein YjbI with pentapeptide repeats
MGFIACLAIVTLSILVYSERKYFDLDLNTQGTFLKKIFRFNAIWLGILILLLSLSCVYLYVQRIQISDKLQRSNESLLELNDYLNIEHQRSKILLLINLIHQVDSAQRFNSNKAETDPFLHRIVALSSSLKIHKEWDIEHRITQSISMERGLLLLALLNSNIDSVFLRKIKENVSFFGADLRNADLRNQNLDGIMLKNANLQNANLQGARLHYANLKAANMEGINLNHASLVGANLIGAKLNWAKINEANLEMARLDSTDLSNATLQNTSLKYVTFINTKLNYALLNNADIKNCYLLNTSLTHANLSNTSLITDSIRSSNWNGAILNNVIIPPNWILLMKENKNTGLDYIIENYVIQSDSTRIKDSVIYFFMPKY